MRASIALVLMMAAVVFSTCGVADAKPFRVYTCTAPDGRALGPALDFSSLPSGWRLAYTGYLDLSLNDRCPLGETVEFRVLDGNAMTAGQSIWARWTAATNTHVRDVIMLWEAYANQNANQASGTIELSVSTDRETLLQQNSPFSIAYGIAFSNTPFHAALQPAEWFEIRLTCLDRCSFDPWWLHVLATHAQFEVDDESAPVGGVTGGAIDAQTWSGLMRLSMNAADEGGGLMQAIVEIDGVDALSIPVADAMTSCHDIGPSPDVNEFAAAQPCPLRIDAGTLDIDTAKLPQGRHTVRILLEDAAGNRTPILGPVVRTIAANGAIGPGSDPALRGALNGDGASDQARLTAHWGRRGSRTRLVSRFGRTHVVRGRLRTSDGAPIANAAIDVVSKTTAVNARELGKRNGPRTRRDGSWFLVLPRRVSSRDVSFRYRSHVNDTIPTTTATVRLRVRAGLRLQIHPRIARRGQVIRFSGRLLGRPLPRGGKQIVLVARASRGAWVRFNVVRTGRDGRFRSTYRFQQPGAARYRFRALSLAEAAYPYLAGGSNVVIVRKL